MDEFDEKNYLQAVGARLHKYRVKMGMSQEQAANAIGISQTQYSKIERGLAKASIITIVKIAYAFEKMSCDYLLLEKEYEQQDCLSILRSILTVCSSSDIQELKEHLLVVEKHAVNRADKNKR